MIRKSVLFSVIAGMMLFSASVAVAVVPAPPVNQTLGMRDVLLGDLTGDDCRLCHSSGVSNRHHLLYGQPIPPGSLVPYRDVDGDGAADTIYGCLNCHGRNFQVQRDCTACHDPATPHHAMPAARSGNCVFCHGDLVDNMTDGHYIPTYPTSRVTPTPKKGDGLPLNSRGKGAGACDYCHDSDNLTPPMIQRSADLHHDPNFDCLWCHDLRLTKPPIRVCEGCHGPDSLHSIQADSPAPGNIGTVVVGGELAGYGHVGRDVAPGDSDCWGCHGYAAAAAPPVSGLVVPTVYSADQTVINAGAETVVILTGAGFTNTVGNNVYEADLTLTSADGSSVTLTPDIIVDEGMLAVTIPANTLPGNYGLRALTAGFTSNPAVISVVPRVRITRATAVLRTVTITGSGFSGYAARSGPSVTGEITTSTGKKMTLSGTIVSWNDGKIVANFAVQPARVTVKSVFGNASSSIVKRAAN